MRAHIDDSDALASGGATRLRTVFSIARVVDYLFAVLYGILIVRLLLEFFQARPGAGFSEFIRKISDPFYSPFKAIVPSTTIEGGHPVVWPLIVCIVAYMVLHAVIRGLLRLAAHRRAVD
ncbi:MAG: YggT family protein [Polyangiaceae bacterium]